MASPKALTAKNLLALGPERMAQLLLDLSEGDAIAQRRLRIELASHTGGDVAGEIRKRLAAIGKARSFVDGRKVKTLARDLHMQREAIVVYVAPEQPGEGFDLLWRMLEMAPALYDRSDDSYGHIGDVIDTVRDDLTTLAERVDKPIGVLVEQVFTALCANNYGQFDGLIGILSPALGTDGLHLLKAKCEALRTRGAKRAAKNDRVVIGFSARGPIYEDVLDQNRHDRLVRAALTEIADALGDVDGFAGHYSAQDRANPAIATAIAQRLLAAGRAEEALNALDLAADTYQRGGYWPDWQRSRIDALDALGRPDDAQAERWQAFESRFDVAALRSYLKRLPDFDDLEAEERALDHVTREATFHSALALLVEWPALERAAALVLSRPDELDGNAYSLLAPAAEALEQRHPLAATLMLRAMISHSLDTGKSKRYGHAARHLQTCGYLARRIEDLAGHPSHEDYAAELRQRHGRKSGFWEAQRDQGD